MKVRRRALFSALGLAGVLITASCVPPGGGGAIVPPPSAPLNLQLSAAGPPAAVDTVHAKWTEAASRLPITGWLVSIHDTEPGSDQTVHAAIAPPSASQYKFSSLRPYSLYDVTVRGISAAGFGRASELEIYTAYGQGAGVACSDPGAIGFGSVCDGFHWIGSGQIAVWNATGARSATGMFLSVTAECVDRIGIPSTPSLKVIGSLSQLGVPGYALSTENNLPCVSAPIRVTEWVKGKYSVGRASLIVYGDSGGPNLGNLSDDVIAVNILR